jgi:hypothetical protein
MSQMRAQDQSLPAAADTRLGVVREADSVARQAALERARPGRYIRRDQRPALPDAIRGLADRPVGWSALQSDIDRFRAVLGGRHHVGQTASVVLEGKRATCRRGTSASDL